MLISKNKPRSLHNLDGMIAEMGLIAAADEGADAQAAQLQAVAHREAASAQRAKIAEQRRALKGSQANASKPTIFGKILGITGRALAAIATRGYSLGIEAALKPKKEGIFAGKANAVFSGFAMLMAPIAGVAAFVADRVQQSERAKGIVRGQVRIELASIEVDRLRKAMTHHFELAKAAGERADGAREEVEQLIGALDRVSRSAGR